MRTRSSMLVVFALTMLSALLLAVPGRAWGDETDTKAKAAPEKGRILAIVGGDVYTITHEVIRGGTVLVKDGKILRVGQDLPIPEGATVIDAKGKYVTPGYV